MNTLEITLLVIQIVYSAAATVVIFCKPIREGLLGRAKEKKAQQKREEEQDESFKCILRSEILDVYNKYKDGKKIPRYDFENVCKMYAQYKKLNGNSFVDEIYTKMQLWEIE